MGNFKVYKTLNKHLGQTAPSAWKCPRTQFLRPSNQLKVWTFSRADPIINKHTEQVNELRMDLSWSWHALNSMLRTCQNSLSHWKARIWLPVTHQPKLAEAEPSFREVNLWVREIWPQIYSLWKALDWGLYCPKF